MSMRGIESQVMMQRTGEYMKDAAVAQKRGEINIQNATRANEAEAQHFKQYIEKLQKKEDNTLKNDLENRGGGREAAGGGQGQRQQQEEAAADTKPVDDTNISIIDVRI